MSWWTTLPFSTIFIMLIALVTDVVTLVATKRVVGRERLELLRKEQSEFLRYLKAGIASNKNKRIVERKRARLRKLQAEILRRQLKLFVIFFPCFLLFFLFLAGIPPQLGIRGIYGAETVAYLPFHFQLLGDVTEVGTELEFFWWYLISAFGFSLPLSRVLGAR